MNGDNLFKNELSEIIFNRFQDNIELKMTSLLQVNIYDCHIEDLSIGLPDGLFYVKYNIVSILHDIQPRS